MIFYEVKVKYDSIDDLPFDGGFTNNLKMDKTAKDVEYDWQKKIAEMNRELGAKCAMDGELSVYVWSAKEGLLNMILACGLDKITFSECKKYIKNYLETNYAVEKIEFLELEEISAEKFNYYGEKGYSRCYIGSRWSSESYAIGTDYFHNSSFTIQEKIAANERMTKNAVLKKAGGILADQTFVDEINRIYSDENEKKYYGNPVHYKVTATSMEAIVEMVDVLVPALYANKRLLSKRITRIKDIEEDCYNEENLEHLFHNAKGSTVIIELAGTDEEHGNYASSYQRVIDFFKKLVLKENMNTLCIFAELANKPGFTKEMVAKLQDEIDIVEIKEGFGDKEQAILYMKNLIEQKDVKATKTEISELLGNKNLFSTGELQGIYKNWFKKGLKCRHYKAYSSLNAYRVEENKSQASPYKELQEMIGLTEIKAVVDEIIDTTKLQKIRSDMGLDNFSSSKHMLFTGNPGSAKTTVARLLAQILREEGVIDTCNYVECGRADLVGKYVGWTAPTIKAKFRLARGGILFIDEAYSLVSDDGYGDEAITTIVQEMENHRDDVIVIFAGYPDKMEKFLDKNEGLRSRIAFHLNFPDYTADEMTDILRLMIKKKGYSASEEIYDKCHKIFEGACKQKEFGNGRFARNLLEQAEMAQSKRIMQENKGKKLSKKVIQTLKPQDFDVTLAKGVKDKKRPLGFAV